MAKQGTFKDLLSGIDTDDKKAIVEEHVKRALRGEFKAMEFLLRHSGEGALSPKPVTFVVSDRPCRKCGKRGGDKPEWVNAT